MSFAHEAWFENQDAFDHDTLAFPEETAAGTNKAQRYRWARRGRERCRLTISQPGGSIDTLSYR